MARSAIICSPARISAEPIPRPLSNGQYGNGAKYLYLDEPTRRVQQGRSEHHVTADVIANLGDQREPDTTRGDPLAQRVHETGHDLPVVAERGQVQVANRCSVLWLLSTKVHRRTVRRNSGNSSVKPS